MVRCVRCGDGDVRDRLYNAITPAEKLFALMMLGDDREFRTTCIKGERVRNTLPVGEQDR